MTHLNHQKTGYTIVEFMVSITLGLLLIATVGTVYLSNKTNYRIQEGLARLQENARFANYYLSHQIRMAGFQGCSGDAFVEMNNHINAPSAHLIYDHPVQGFDGLQASFSPNLPAHLSGKPVPGTDVLEIRRGSSNNTVQLSTDMLQSDNTVPVYSGSGIQAGDAVMISDCSVGDIFKASAGTTATRITHNAGDNNSEVLTVPYRVGSHVMQYLYYAFYIKDTGRTNSANEPIYALVREDQDGNEVEIVEGIEQMKVLYGVDTNDDRAADHYQTATEVNNSNNWDNVISLKLNLLFATIENVSTKIQPYEFNGITYTPNDQKLRREWQNFVTLRNRGLPS